MHLVRVGETKRCKVYADPLKFRRILPDFCKFEYELDSEKVGEILNDDGTTRPIWWQVESGVVGADGMAHTSSPPYNGVNGKSLYMVAYGDVVGSVQLQQALNSRPVNRP